MSLPDWDQNGYQIGLDRKGKTMLGFMGLGTLELVVVAGVILLLFGNRLPRAMRSLGEGFQEFKRGINSGNDEPRIGQPSESGSDSSSHD